MLNKKIQKVAEVATKLNLVLYSPRIKLLGLYLYENNTNEYLHKMPKLPFPICKLMAAILQFLLISLLFFKSIVKNEFLIPKYSRIEVLVMIVAPQDQF